MQTPDYHAELARYFAASRGKRQLLKVAVNAPFVNKIEATRLGLGIVVLLAADKSQGLIHRIALSDTDLAKGTTAISVKRFEDIKIPLDNPDNVIAQAIRTGKPHGTADWQYLFTPALTADESRLNQAGGSIGYSVYPIAGAHSGGAIIFSYYQYPEKIGTLQHAFMEFYQQLVTQHLGRYL